MKHEARIRTLATRYEACLTTEAEERELRSLLSDEQTLPRDLQALAVMLGGLEALGEEQLPRRITRPTRKARATWWQWGVAVAAFIAIALLIDHFSTPYCYINGEAIYDPEVALANTDCLAQLEHLDQSFELLDALLITNN